MQIREFTMQDYDDVIHLWKSAGLAISPTETVEGIQHKLLRDPEIFLVAESDGRIVGAVLGSYDGRRGWVNKLAVASEQQGGDIGSQLMAELEKRLKAIGCVKVNLLIEMYNQGVQNFYAKRGFVAEDLIFMEKLL